MKPLLFRRAAPVAWPAGLGGLLRAAVAAPALALALASFMGPAAAAEDPAGGDPFGSLLWPDLRAEFLGRSPVVFDPRVQVSAPPFAEDPMNVPVSVSVDGLAGVELILVFVDRNPIRKVLEYLPLGSLPRVSFRFKLQQASPVRAAARTRDGVWHVGGAWVDSAGGGCTVPGETRKDGSWSRTLGEVSARLFPPTAGAAEASSTRLRLRVMHPMDTGLANGIPAFFINRLSLRDEAGRELLRLQVFEPVSENPVFSFDFPGRPPGRLRLVGTDNNGNRISGAVE